MADPRNPGLHGYPPGVMNMMQTPYFPPNMGLQSTGMMRPGMNHYPLPIRPPMYPVQPGFMPGPMMVNRAQMSAPPAYSPQMATNFRARQRTPEQIREQQEQFRKDRQYQEQRAKLQSFGRVGPAGRSEINADRLIESMFGKSDRTKARSVQQQQPAIGIAADMGDDSFGEFMAGPNSNTVSNQQDTVALNITPMPQSGVPPSEQCTIPSSQGSAIPQTQTSHTSNQNSTQAPSVKPEKDLLSMMMECSDLTAPKEAKHFHKKQTVKHVQPTHHLTTLQQSQSQQARNWEASSNLQGLFQIPVQSPHSNPDPAGNTGQPTVPAWCHSPEHLPPLFRQVEEAVVLEGKVITERVYPILLMSGLSRENLRHIWSLANQTTPGELQVTELYMVLAMIALAQNNYTIPSLTVLSQCPSPPVPFLGMTGQPVPVIQQQQQTHSIQQQQNEPISSSSAVTTQMSTVQQPMTVGEADMEFTAFQEGPTCTATTSKDQVDDFGDFKAAETTDKNIKIDTKTSNQRSVHLSPLPLPRLEETLSPEEQHSNVSNFFCSDDSSSGKKSTTTKKGPTTPNSLEDYFFDDVKSGASKDSSQFSTHSDVSEGEDFKNFDMYVEQFSSKEELSVTVSPVPSSVGRSTIGPAQDVSLQAKRSPTRSTLRNANTIARNNIRVPPPKLNPVVKPEEDDFADFQEAAAPPSSSSELNLMGDDNSEDKYAALRGWTKPLDRTEPKSLLDADSSPVVSQTNLTQDQPVVQEEDKELQEDDWADFTDSSAFPSSETTTITSTDLEQKSNNSDSYFPSVKSAHTNSPFPPMVVNDFPSTSLDHDNSTSLTNNSKTVPTSLFTSGSQHKSFPTPVSRQDSTPSKELTDVDFDDTRVPPPMDFVEDIEDDFKDTSFNDSVPTLDPNSPMFETTFDQHHSPNVNTEHAGFSWNESKNSTLFQSANPTPTLSWGSFANASLEGISKSDNNGLHVSGLKMEDGKSVSSLDFENPSSKAGDDNGQLGSGGLNAESKSVDSFDIQEEENLDFTGSSCTPESKSLDSLDLKKVDSREWSPDDTDETSTGAPQGTINNQQTKDIGSVPVSAQILLQNGALPTLGDRYSGVIEQVQGSDLHVQEWERCLESANQILYNANSVFNSISSSAVSNEIINCGSGSDYLTGVVEIYRVVRRISLAMDSSGISSEKLNSVLKTINLGWSNLTAFIASSPIMPDPSSLDYRIAVLKSDDTASQFQACGVCLLNVDSKSKAFNEEKEGSKLRYGGRQYHTSCANFWVNCVSPMLPALSLPDLL